MMSSNKRIRTLLNGTNKLFSFPETYEELLAIIGILYNLPARDLMNLSLTYLDDEGDNVSVSNTFDLQQAKLFTERENCNILNVDVALEPPQDKFFEMGDNNFFDFINVTTETIRKEPLEEDINSLDKKIAEIKINDEVRQSFDLGSAGRNQFEKMVEKKIEEQASELSKIIKELALFKQKETQDKAQIAIRNFIMKTMMKNFYSAPYVKSKEEKDRPIDLTDNLPLEEKQDEDNKDIQDFVTHLITSKMEEFKDKLMEKTMKKTDKLLKQMLNKKHYRIEEFMKEESVHRNVSCEGCKVQPIIGIRYKCSVCPEFNYCKDCEDKFKDEHTHPFIKIRRPEMYLSMRLSLDKNEESADEIQQVKEKYNVEEELSSINIGESSCIQETVKSSDILVDNFLNKNKNITDKEKSSYFLDLAKNMKMLYDLSAIDDSKILEALDKAKGNVDEALILLFNCN